MKPTVVITGPIRQVALEKIRQHAEVRIWESTEPVPKELLRRWLADAEGLFLSGKIRLDEELLSFAPRLKVAVQAAVGYDNVDVEACTRRGIPFGNTPGVLVDATADLAFALVLNSMRRITEGWDMVRRGEWKNLFDIPFGSDLAGKWLGIVGMGRIGEAVARRAQAFKMRVQYTNRKRRADEAEIGAVYVPFEQLLQTSDVIVVLTPLTDETRGMFGEEQFRLMKPTARFVNVARGAIVQTEALYRALKEGWIAYAALDVTDPEPLPGDHPLLQLPNLLITPHVGSATDETRDRMALLATDNLLAGLAGKPLPACVNESVNYRHEN
ncbi:MAG: D-glycerate dehydrogenase [Bacillus thermozeamaize]|uniref:D-glycerate dehydrogenase n=1 Tax=Bacillus thermozeamaize TaxID=230954 RepID=A0A1Y3PSH1_9BACI|nr:MAG: D-glycerate dehydrogenase [Bacillus thermozeamaize]